MIVCQCAVLQCNSKGRCDVKTAVDALQQHRQSQGLTALVNTPTDVKKGVAAVYQHHHKARGIRPCPGCVPFMEKEVAEILTTASCPGSVALRKEAA